MTKSNSKRVLFADGGQAEFLEAARSSLNMKTRELAGVLNISQRTLTDWKRGKYTLRLDAVEMLSCCTGIQVPDDVSIRDRFWYTASAASTGGLARYRKYGCIGNPEYRKQRWRQWWEREGKVKSRICSARSIRIPPLSAKLAEFVGIVMGDGGITGRQIFISTSSTVDREYSAYVKALIEALFKVPVSQVTRNGENTIVLVVSRKKLVEFCHTKLGLLIGDKIKQGLDIPLWINDDPTYSRACLKGLFDTDGGIFYERHGIGKRVYSYPRWSFVSRSPALRNSVLRILAQLEFSPVIRNDRSVQLESAREIRRYFSLVGTGNPKHLRRLSEG